jgi:hypothetical protein
MLASRIDILPNGRAFATNGIPTAIAGGQTGRKILPAKVGRGFTKLVCHAAADPVLKRRYWNLRLSHACNIAWNLEMSSLVHGENVILDLLEFLPYLQRGQPTSGDMIIDAATDDFAADVIPGIENFLDMLGPLVWLPGRIGVFAVEDIALIVSG